MGEVGSGQEVASPGGPARSRAWRRPRSRYACVDATIYRDDVAREALPLESGNRGQQDRVAFSPSATPSPRSR